MFPIQSFVERFAGILKELDVLADGARGDAGESLEDLNAEFEDALLLLGELEPRDEDFGEELADALEELLALAGDYRRLTPSLPEIADPARRLEMAVEMARGSAEA